MFLFGCHHIDLSRAKQTSIDRNGKKYLMATRELVLDKDFEAAVTENQRILEYYSQITGKNDVASSNYALSAEVISELLTRIMEDEYREQTLSRIIESTENQIKVITLSREFFEKKAHALEKKMDDMDRLSGKVTALEKEKEMLQQQIDQLKKIDLNPDPVRSKQATE
jgi:septal ring factor EnvC (AmiA/AmiB activator)